MGKKKIVLLLVVMTVFCGIIVKAVDKASWPRTILVSDTMLIVYQPKLDAFANSELKARTAVEIQLDGVEKSLFCSVWFKADCNVDKVTRKVYLKGITIEKIILPGVSDQEKEKIGKIIKHNFLKNSSAISLDYLLAMLAQAEQKKLMADELSTQVPKILFSTTPMVLIRVEGAPKLMPVNNDNKLAKVINSDTLIIFDKSQKKYYLQFAGKWFSNREIGGSWEQELTIPAKIKQLGTEVKVTKSATADFKGKVYVATQPTVLLQAAGKPEIELIPRTNLLYVKNSDDDIFQDIKTQQLYVLIAGRWFTAKHKTGPWSYISSRKLPKEFSKIPQNSAKATVLSSIAGTPEAKAAILENSIAQTTTIKRSEEKLKVEYDGEPKFVAITGTKMSYAINTADAVLKINDQYYCCNNAIWFTAKAANGPWQVAVTVPETVNLLPPTVPVYNIKFAKIYEYDKSSDEVTIGYTAGYNDSFVFDGGIVYGTGYNYQPWIDKKYYYRAPTYGIEARYNPVFGEWNSTLMAAARPEVTLYGKARINLKSKLPQAVVEQQKKREAKAKKLRSGSDYYVADDGSVYRKSLDGWERVSSGKVAKTDNKKLFAGLNQQLLATKRVALKSRAVSTRVNSRGYRNYNNNNRKQRYRSYRAPNGGKKRYRNYYKR
jgi:hypothetical protein